MYLQQDPSSEHLEARLKKAGKYLNELRAARDMTQRELAEKAGIDPYTLISHLECGASRVPSNLYAKFSQALGVPTAEFAKNMLKFYDPFIYRALFEPPDTDPD